MDVVCNEGVYNGYGCWLNLLESIDNISFFLKNKIEFMQKQAKIYVSYLFIWFVAFEKNK